MADPDERAEWRHNLGLSATNVIKIPFCFYFLRQQFVCKDIQIYFPSKKNLLLPLLRSIDNGWSGGFTSNHRNFNIPLAATYANATIANLQVSIQLEVPRGDYFALMIRHSNTELPANAVFLCHYEGSETEGSNEEDDDSDITRKRPTTGSTLVFRGSNNNHSPSSSGHDNNNNNVNV